MIRLLNRPLLMLLLAALTARAAGTGDPDLVVRGQAIVQSAVKELSGKLLLAMTAGGPTNAIEFCSVNGLPLTRKIATAEGVILARVSHRPRNPANAASASERTVLDGWAKDLAAGRTPAPLLQPGDDGAITFLAPITINNPLCLNCHGDTTKDIKSETLVAIRKKYPKDQSTGFALNDLRGMWRIEFRAAAP